LAALQRSQTWDISVFEAFKVIQFVCLRD